MSNTNKGKELYTPEELIWATQLAYCNFKIEKMILEKLSKKLFQLEDQKYTIIIKLILPRLAIKKP